MKVKCLKCGTILESTQTHHLIWCICGNLGLDYAPSRSRILCKDSKYEILEK